MAKKNTTNTPLTPAVFHILLALSTQERHGYEIMKQVENDSLAKVKMGPGTLYGSIGRMSEAGLIRESDKLMINKPQVSSVEAFMGVLGVLGLNGFFVMMFIGSGLLFRRSRIRL